PIKSAKLFRQLSDLVSYPRVCESFEPSFFQSASLSALLLALSPPSFSAILNHITYVFDQLALTWNSVFFEVQMRDFNRSAEIPPRTRLLPTCYRQRTGQLPTDN